LALTDAVADPVIAHVNGFGAALFDCIIGNAGCCAVVGFDTRGRWGWPISISVVWSVQPSWPLR
jgi:hypothetical protein